MARRALDSFVGRAAAFRPIWGEQGASARSRPYFGPRDWRRFVVARAMASDLLHDALGVPAARRDANRAPGVARWRPAMLTEDEIRTVQADWKSVLPIAST